MNVLVVGSGGREHALAWKLASSSKVKNVETLGYSSDKLGEILTFAHDRSIDLTVVGPDQALADGIVDIFESEGKKIYGPTKEAARIESSKSFAKKIMKSAGIPTADYHEFEKIEDAYSYLEGEPSSIEQYVVKKDGLALGKGVVICEGREQTRSVIHRFMVEEKCSKIIIEEFLEGRELSFFAICDGSNFTTLGYASDYKRIRDNDEGPNTGGMGAYGLVEWVTPSMEQDICENIIQKLLDEMKERGIPFKGTLFVGLIYTREGFRVLEFNARFGDPETQALLPLIREDFFQVIMDAVEEKLCVRDKKSLELFSQTSVHVVLAAHGYPGTEGISVRKNDPVTIPSAGDGEFIFLAGIKKLDKDLLTNGGRVLGVTALAENRVLAREKAYRLVAGIHFNGMQFRRDIAK